MYELVIILSDGSFEVKGTFDTYEDAENQGIFLTSGGFFTMSYQINEVN